MEMQNGRPFSNRLFVTLMIGLVITILIDTSVVKVNDLIDKYFIPLQGKLILFSINSAICLLLQYSIIRYIKNSFEGERRSKTLKIKLFHLISIISLAILRFFNRIIDFSAVLL